MLVIDAFSSDAIPVHLITSEALALYAKNIKPGGVIAFHVTNRFLDLVPGGRRRSPTSTACRRSGSTTKPSDVLASRSDWVLVSNNRALLESPDSPERDEIEPRPEWRLWTDDFNNLFQVVRR